MTNIEKAQIAKAEKTLNKLFRFDGVVMSIRQFVETAVSENKSIEVYEQNKIKEMSRTAFNRATGKEQDEHDRRIREGGKVKCYLIDSYEMPKPAYDYAVQIKSIR